MKKKYNFRKFVSLGYGQGAYKGGLTITKSGLAYIMEKKFPDYDRIDILLDDKNHLIKIVKGKDFKICRSKRGLRGFYHSFSARSLVKSGVAKGHYIYLGEGIFQLETFKNEDLKNDPQEI